MDDDKQVLNTVHSMLTLMGHDVVLAADGEEAINIYREALMAGKGFAAVIMDLTIPGGMGGLEAMQHLLVIDPEVKAIVSSGYSDEMVMEDYRKWGFKGTVPKPYTIKELSDVLNNIIGQ
jgi:CheY-like chemotaxis protein